MKEPQEYIVTVSGFHSGTHRLVVKCSPSNKDTRYVSGEPFGCSRDYFVESDSDAINRLMSEHNCQVLDIRKPENREV